MDMEKEKYQYLESVLCKWAWSYLDRAFMAFPQWHVLRHAEGFYGKNQNTGNILWINDCM